jgi:type I restriction enzyme, S subunit
MVEEEYRLLRFANFMDFNKWDVKRFFVRNVNSKYPILLLKDLLNEETHKVHPSKQPEKEFGILGVSNQTGMFDAYTEKGKNINQPYKIVKNDFIAYNPYRVNVGSIGIKKNNLKNTYISSAYIVFSTERKLLPDYLYMLMCTSKFNQLIRDNTTGSVRQTLSFKNLGVIKIPLPPKSEQQKLVDEYSKTVSKAVELEKQAGEIEKEINGYVFDVLGIKYTKKNTEHSKLHYLKLTDTYRWDVDYLLGKESTQYLSTSKFPLTALGNLILLCQYGSSDKADRNSQNVPVLRMNNIFKSELDISDLKYLPMETKGIEKYYLNKNDLLFNRTNSKELVGKTALFNLDGKYVFASYLVRVVFDTNRVNPKYVNYLFATSIIRDQIDLISRHILGQANVNTDELKSFVIPLPPFSKQTEIANHIDELKDQKRSLQSQAKTLQEKAKSDFEDVIFTE